MPYRELSNLAAAQTYPYTAYRFTPRSQVMFMPYRDISELPAAQTDQYTAHQKKAFLEAFNHAYEEYHGDESRAFAIAHTAAKRASPDRERASPDRAKRSARGAPR